MLPSAHLNVVELELGVLVLGKAHSMVEGLPPDQYSAPNLEKMEAINWTMEFVVEQCDVVF